jgi:glyoxylase-like metal-dependent hydrolase (beta-lactamase superfamily II)
LRKLLAEDGRPCCDPEVGRLISSVHTWAIRSVDRTILVDTGAGNDKPRPAFPRFDMQRQPYLERLELAGILAEAVTHVLCTHLHVDHCGWNTRMEEGRWRLTFPNAVYVFPRVEYTDCLIHGSSHRNDTMFRDSVEPVVAAGQAQLIEGGETIAGLLEALPFSGHSRRSMVYRLARGGDAPFIGDVMHQPLQARRPE